MSLSARSSSREGHQRHGRFLHLWNPQGCCRRSCGPRIVGKRGSDVEWFMNKFHPELSLVAHLGGRFAQPIATTKGEYDETGPRGHVPPRARYSRFVHLRHPEGCCEKQGLDLERRRARTVVLTPSCRSTNSISICLSSQLVADTLEAERSKGAFDLDLSLVARLLSSTHW